MRKLLVVALVVFALAFTLGIFTAPQSQAAGGGSTKCWYTCDCNGTVLYCCRYGAIVNCKVVVFAPIECTQQADC